MKLVPEPRSRQDTLMRLVIIAFLVVFLALNITAGNLWVAGWMVLCLIFQGVMWRFSWNLGASERVAHPVYGDPK